MEILRQKFLQMKTNTKILFWKKIMEIIIDLRKLNKMSSKVKFDIVLIQFVVYGLGVGWGVVRGG